VLAESFCLLPFSCPGPGSARRKCNRGARTQTSGKKKGGDCLSIPRQRFPVPDDSGFSSYSANPWRSTPVSSPVFYVLRQLPATLGEIGIRRKPLHANHLQRLTFNVANVCMRLAPFWRCRPFSPESANQLPDPAS